MTLFGHWLVFFLVICVWIFITASADCHYKDRQKLSIFGLSNPVRTNTGHRVDKVTDAQLLLEVENQLMQNGGNWTFNELKASFQKYYEKGARNGLIDNKEVIFIGEINSQGLFLLFAEYFWFKYFLCSNYSNSDIAWHHHWLVLVLSRITCTFN